MAQNNPQFKITGNERRFLKKKISSLKRSFGSFLNWYDVTRDMYNICCHENPISIDNAEQLRMECVAEIERLESLLSEPFSINMV